MMPRSWKLSVVIPCFNEASTLADCVDRVLRISDERLELEVLIVDDCSTDDSLALARELAWTRSGVSVLHHDVNRGKGAALRTGFGHATGDFVAVQDADLEYDPEDLKRLLGPLVRGHADVVLGSRFQSADAHRVLHFWHSVANRCLTTLSNMFTDLNLTDMETCYKVFRREVIQSIDLREDRFGFEPEIVAKIARRRLRIFEMGISYAGRTYEEGKKIGWKDAVRALYCIVRYSGSAAPVPLQLAVYLFIGIFAGLINLILFGGLLAVGVSITASVLTAFAIAAIANDWAGVSLLFRRHVRWRTPVEAMVYGGSVAVLALVDLGVTRGLIAQGLAPMVAKATATVAGFALNFSTRRFIVFAEERPGPWAPQHAPSLPAAAPDIPHGVPARSPVADETV